MLAIRHRLSQAETLREIDAGTSEANDIEPPDENKLSSQTVLDAIDDLK
jgi:hypothetical protein